MLFLVISHLSILAVLPFFSMSSKRPQSARQPAPMPAVEGYTDPQKERLEKKQRQNPVKTTRALNKFGEQLMTAALSTAINTVAPSGPVSSAAPVLGVPFEVPTKSARAATDSTSAVPSAAVPSSSAAPPLPAQINAVARSIVSRASTTPEPRNIYSPDGSGTKLTFREVVQLVREGRYQVKDFARSFMFSSEYWLLIEAFLRQFQLCPEFADEKDAAIRYQKLKRILVLDEKYQNCCEWSAKQSIDASYEYTRYIAAKAIRPDSDEARRLDSDRISYVNKTRAWAIEQILQDHPDIFPGAAEEAFKVFDQIFQRDERGNIVPYHYNTHFGADTRDSEYLSCLLYMLPAEAKRIFKSTFIGQALEYPRH